MLLLLTLNMYNSIYHYRIKNTVLFTYLLYFSSRQKYIKDKINVCG
jgi:hypothetical protein